MWLVLQGTGPGRLMHQCHAESCTKEVAPRLLMCARHWRAVPKPVQDLVWRFYRVGQEERKDPSAAYMAAQRLAVAAVVKSDTRRSELVVEARRWASRGDVVEEVARAIAAVGVLADASAQPGLFGGGGG